MSWTGRGARAVGAAAVVACSLAFVACGDDDAESTSAQPARLTSIKIGAAPLAGHAPFYVARDQGIFEKHGLKVEIVTSPAGTPALVPLLVSGDIQFMGAGPLTALTAQAQGLDFVFTGTVSSASESGKSGGIMVKGDSTYKKASDLNGKRLCATAGVADWSFRAWMQKHGGDGPSIKLVPLPFAAHKDALKAGRCEVFVTGSPYFEPALKEGYRSLGDAAGVFGGDHAPEVVVSAQRSYVDSHPEIVKEFMAAVAEATKLAQEKPDIVRKLLPEYAGSSVEQANDTVLPVYNSVLNTYWLQKLADSASDLGYLSKPVVVKPKVWSGATVSDDAS